MSSDKKFFRTLLQGLEIVVGSPDPTKGEVAPKTVGFVPYWEEKRGVEGRFKVGYLATDNGSAIKKLEDDPNVQEIDEKAYKEMTTESFDNDGNQVTGLRAPY